MDMPTEKMENKILVDRPVDAVIYGASVLSVLLSLLVLPKSRSLATFMGLWAPTILGLGIFLKENKIIDWEKRHA